MENEEMTNDAAVAWYYEFGDTGEAGPVTFGGDPGREAIEWAERYGHTLHYLVHATTVAELRAEVERLRKYSERLSSELSEMAQVCGEAYQVVGILLDETEQFGSEHGDKILTNLWEGKLIHKDVIPWSFKADRHG